MNKKDERLRVDIFFHPQKDADLIAYMEESKVPRATLIRALMREAISKESASIDYKKMAAVMRKVIRDEGVAPKGTQPTQKISEGRLGGLAKKLGD